MTAPFVSYSANYEDVYLRRLFGERAQGFFVDVGAAHPVFENDTKALYDRGWRGINIEPNGEFFTVLAAERPGDRNLDVVVSDQPGQAIFYRVPGTGLSTADPAQAARARGAGHTVIEQHVMLRTLGDILAEAAPPVIDLLKVDVEGGEPGVLRSNDWDRFRPRLIIVEATFPETAERRPDEVTPLLEQQGYRQVFFDGLNDYYAERGFAVPDSVFGSPVNIFDRFIPHAQARLMDTAAFLSDQAATLTTERDSLAAHLAAVTAERDSVAAHAQHLQQTAAEARTYAESLRDALQDGTRQRRLLQHLSEAQAVDLARAGAEIVAMREGTRAIGTQLDQAVAELAELRRVRERERAEWHGRVEALERQADALREAIDARADESESLRRSTSWRLTRPIRAFRRPGRTLKLLFGRGTD